MVLFFTKLEATKAVSGTQITIAQLPINAEAISVTTEFRLMNFIKSMFDARSNKGRELPKYTRISVLAIVPIISRPTFIPQAKSSLIVLVLSTIEISLIVLAIDIATSITAPNVARIIVEIVRLTKFSSGWAEKRKIEFSLLYPVREASFVIKNDSKQANIRLKKQPIVAAVLFLLKPPTRYIVIAVESKQINIVAKVGLIPNNIIGLSK